jgi:hypothetical protein
VTVSLRNLRQRCETLLRDLDVPEPFALDSLCAMLGERRGRPLVLDVLPEPTSQDAPCGVWLALESEDVILVEPTTSPLHREHIVLHEIGHLLCDHATSAPLTYMQRRLFPDLDPAMVARVLGRTSYTDPQEQEAEMIASLIQSRIRRRREEAGPELSDRSGGAEVLDRLSRTLGSATA